MDEKKIFRRKIERGIDYFKDIVNDPAIFRGVSPPVGFKKKDGVYFFETFYDESKPLCGYDYYFIAEKEYPKQQIEKVAEERYSISFCDLVDDYYCVCFIRLNQRGIDYNNIRNDKTDYLRKILSKRTANEFYSSDGVSNLKTFGVESFDKLVDAIDEELYKITGKQYLFYSFFHDSSLSEPRSTDYKRVNEFIAEILYYESIRIN